MATLKTLKPGQRGTRDLLARYGSSLLYVRYRRDDDTGERLKTVELVVQRRCPRSEAGPAPGRSGVRAGGVSRGRVALRIGLQERDLQRRVRSAGGRWDPVRRVWMLPREVAERLELMRWVVGGGS